MAKSKDLDAILRAFDAIPKAARKPIRAAIEKGAGEMVARMKYLAPEDDGDLQRSIKAEITSDVSATVTAGDESTMVEARKGSGVLIQNALLQEYGYLSDGKGRNQTARPFFWVSVNSLKKRVRRRVDRSIGKSVKDIWSKS